MHDVTRTKDDVKRFDWLEIDRVFVYSKESYKAEVDVERTDSGVGGDMGQTPRLRRSWEEIVQKSSEHWSIVASSARHWQEMARRSRAEGKAGKPAAKKKLSLVITDDMVSDMSPWKRVP